MVLTGDGRDVGLWLIIRSPDTNHTCSNCVDKDYPCYWFRFNQPVPSDWNDSGTPIAWEMKAYQCLNCTLVKSTRYGKGCGEPPVFKFDESNLTDPRFTDLYQARLLEDPALKEDVPSDVELDSDFAREREYSGEADCTD